MKFDLTGYYKPTPEKVRKIGDLLQYGSQIFAGTQIMENPKISLIVLIVGSVGKILSNFFVDENAKSN